MSAATLPLSAHQALTLETLNFWADRNVLNLLLWKSYVHQIPVKRSGSAFQCNSHCSTQPTQHQHLISPNPTSPAEIINPLKDNSAPILVSNTNVLSFIFGIRFSFSFGVRVRIERRCGVFEFFVLILVAEVLYHGLPMPMTDIYRLLLFVKRCCSICHLTSPKFLTTNSISIEHTFAPRSYHRICNNQRK